MERGRDTHDEVGSRTDRAAAWIEEIIAERSLGKGDRLPTVRELSTHFGVSVSVVREAVATLKAKGVVSARQGAGIFVNGDPNTEERVSWFACDFTQVSSIVESLELRMAVEIEAAALAAERRSMAQESRIHEAFTDIQKMLDRGHSAEKEDFRFHMTIAEATNNRFFVEFLKDLGSAMIPRSRVHIVSNAEEARKAYLKKGQNEHRCILQAISQRNPDAARNAMRLHLSGSRDRYHAFLVQT